LENATKLSIDIKNNKILKNLDFLDTGESKSSTKECVDHVKHIISNNNIDINSSGVITKNIKEALEKEDIEKFNLSIRENQHLLESLGVVPDKVKKIIKDLFEKGVYSKISGSGSVKNGASGLLIISKNKK